MNLKIAQKLKIAILCLSEDFHKFPVHLSSSNCKRLFLVNLSSYANLYSATGYLNFQIM